MSQDEIDFYSGLRNQINIYKQDLNKSDSILSTNYYLDQGMYPLSSSTAVVEHKVYGDSGSNSNQTQVAARAGVAELQKIEKEFAAELTISVPDAGCEQCASQLDSLQELRRIFAASIRRAEEAIDLGTAVKTARQAELAAQPPDPKPSMGSGGLNKMVDYMTAIINVEAVYKVQFGAIQGTPEYKPMMDELISAYSKLIDSEQIQLDGMKHPSPGLDLQTKDVNNAVNAELTKYNQIVTLAGKNITEVDQKTKDGRNSLDGLLSQFPDQ